MLQNHLSKLFAEALSFDPTQGQKALFDKLALFLTGGEGYTFMIINGYAGTGKTSAISAAVRVLGAYNQTMVLLAPTGRAAKVFSLYSGKQAHTIHKQIYRQRVAADMQSDFTLNHNGFANALFIVDEASMISNQVLAPSIFGSGNLLRDLIDYVAQGRNCKLLLVGDDAQLPPVGLEHSPALSQELLISYGKVLYCRLREVVRQRVDSGILANATAIRMMLNSQQIGLPSMSMGYSDIQSIDGSSLLETLEECYDRYGRDQVVVITRSNKRANIYNNGIRQQILFREDMLSVGDSIMVVKNNYFWTNSIKELDFIANGDIAVVERIGRYENRYGLQFVNVTLRFPDYGELELDVKIIVDALNSDSTSLSAEQSRMLYEGVNEDYQEVALRKLRWQKVREDPFYNALQVKFAYAITCHKAQGGQWPVVFIDHGYFTKEMLSIDFLRWLYTAFTRATEKVFLVNFDKKFFEALW